MIRTLLDEPWNGWKRFWFEPETSQSIIALRIAIACVAALWFASFWGGVNVYFSTNGLLNLSMAGEMIQFEETPSWQHWSPLWWTESSWSHQLWLAAGIVSSLLALLGIGGRITLSLLLFLIVGWTHRIVWLQGIVAPALTSMVAYLMIANPAGRLFASDARRLSLATSWNRLARRLIQTHCWLLMAYGLLSQLAGVVWWRGEAVWWLAAAGRSQLLTIEWLRGSPFTVNLLTHGFVLSQALALWLLVQPSTRRLGVAMSCIALIFVGFVADQTLYALLLASGLLAWRKPVQG